MYAASVKRQTSQAHHWFLPAGVADVATDSSAKSALVEIFAAC